jgi:DNA-directed RNA polymerase sigma subunit (sigma70/sigma32)
VHALRQTIPSCSLEELAARLGTDATRLAHALAASQAGRVISLDQAIGAEEEGQLLDVMSDGQRLEVQDDHVWLQRGLAQLSEQARRVLALRYGGEDLRSLSQVASCMGLTKSTVQGLEQRALRQLRACLHPRMRQEMAASLNA